MKKPKKVKIKRRIMKSKKILSLVCLFFVLIIVLTLACGVFIRMDNNLIAEASTSARAMCVMEQSSKRVLYSKNQSAKLPMASTTKIMTAITAIENCDDLDKTFEITPKAVGISGTSLYLRKGEVMSIRDLLYGLMLVSGNDASVAIGEHISGSSKKFVDLMNETARKIGAKNSHFDNTHGLDSPTHYTTAEDLALITSHALENDIFKEIVSTKNTKITNTAGKTRYLRNKNKLLTSLEGCCGVKTGFTDDAGRCLVSACERDGMTLVCVVLNCGPMFEESKTLLEKGYEEYQLIDLTSGYDYIDRIKVTGGKQESVKIGTTGKFLYPLRSDEISKVDYVYNIQEKLEAPVDKGEEIGEIKIFIDNNLIFSEKVVTMEVVRRNSIWTKLHDLIENW